jgi:methionyl-tRNA formyltransferase
MRLVFMGTPDFAVPSLHAAVEGGHEIAAVVTRPDRPRRRERSAAEPSAVKQAAMALGLPVLQPASAREPEFAAELKALAPQTIVVVAFGQILPPAVLRTPPRWCINLHASLLPRHRGAAPIARAILAGDATTGVTTMRMDEGLDTGDILLTRQCAIDPAETAGDLTDRLSGLGAALLRETLVLHDRAALEPVPQDPSAATLAPRLRKEEGRLAWDAPASQIAARIRACNPWPAAVAALAGATVQLLRGVACPTRATGIPEAEPGRVVGAEDDGILVRCGGGSLLTLFEIRFRGRRAMTGRDALNGRKVRVGDLFEPAPGG